MGNFGIVSDPERVARLLPMERREVVAQAMVLAGGFDLKKPHPLACDLARGLDSNRAMQALTGKENAAAASWTSSDMRGTIAQAIGLIIEEARRAQPTPEHWALCRRLSLPNFRANEVPQLSGGASVFATPENGEIRSTGVMIDGQTAQLTTYAGYAPISRQTVINASWDHLGLTAVELLNAALQKERAAFADLIESNPLLVDGVPLFDASRGNEFSSPLTPSTDEVTWLAPLLAALRRLTNASGNALSLSAFALLCPPESELYARTLATRQLPGLEVFVDASLTHVALLPNPMVRPVAGLATLGKAQWPVVDTAEPNFECDLWRIRVRHDFAIVPLSAYAVRIPVG
jgi:hypothetical protein